MSDPPSPGDPRPQGPVVRLPATTARPVTSPASAAATAHYGASISTADAVLGVASSPPSIEVVALRKADASDIVERNVDSGRYYGRGIPAQAFENRVNQTGHWVVGRQLSHGGQEVAKLHVSPGGLLPDDLDAYEWALVLWVERG